MRFRGRSGAGSGDAPDDPAAEVSPVGRPRRTRGARVLLGLAVIATVMVVGLGVLPTRTWFGQRQEIEQAEAQLHVLRTSNARLSAKIDHLSDKSSIERQAREQFGFVDVGEESYTIPPASTPTVNLPPVWPFDLLQDPVARAAARQGR